MIIYPAIDLLDGRCVRLSQGRFDQSTLYPAAPGEALSRFAEAGASWAHVVDLDGARAGQASQHKLLSLLARSSPLRLQVAGGFRTREQVAHMLESGAGRVVIGSLAVEQPALARQFLDEFGSDAIALALDVRLIDGIPMVAHRGWTENSGRSLFDIAAEFPTAKHILVTDISRDGMQRGTNVELVQSITQRFPNFSVQASGGLASLDEIRPLKVAGAAGAIVGKALWEGRIDLGEAVANAGA